MDLFVQMAQCFMDTYLIVCLMVD